MADVVDTRTIGKCDPFQGDDASWSGWRFRFEAWIGLLKFEGVKDVHSLLDEAARTAEIVANDVLTEGAADMSRKLYAILVQLLRGRSLNMARQTGRGQGLELWRMLCREYEGSVGARTPAILMGILQTPWQTKAVAQDFLFALTEWELQIADYEQQSSERVSQGTKVATVLRHAPAAVREILRMTVANVGTDYERVRSSLQLTLVSTAHYDARGARASLPSSGQAGIPGDDDPMQVGTLQGKGPGKG